MSDAPKHIWPVESVLQRLKLANDGSLIRGDHRYTLTSGEEWDTLMERAKSVAFPSEPYYEDRLRLVLRALLHYFKERNDGR